MTQVDASGVEGILRDVVSRIDKDELIDLALTLGNIDSPTGGEGPVGEAIYEWLAANDLQPRRIGLMEGRPNIVGRISGQGDGDSLLLNSHMDTHMAAYETLATPHAAARHFHEAWREGDRLFGNGIVNNKGPMATWMIACKALKEAGVPLSGDLVMTMVVGEIGLEPVDEFVPPEFVAKDAGARHLVNRGIVADYGVVAEGTDFKLCWVENGKAFFKVMVHGHEPPLYTPYLQRPHSNAESPNALVRASLVIQALEEWAWEYQQKYRYECEGGIAVPKVSVNAARSGTPFKITKTPSICNLYVDIRINPDQDSRMVERELKEVLAKTGIPTSIEPIAYRRGYEADAQKVKPLVENIERAHDRVFGGKPGLPIEPITSMWRDSNVFNEVGMPCVIYGPGASVGGGNFAMDISAMTKAAEVYCGIALEVCGVES